MIQKVFMLFALALVVTNSATAQKYETIKGEGDVVRQEISLPAIHGVHLGMHADVFLTPGSPQKVVIEAQQNILDRIKRDVRDDQWYITFDGNIRECKPVKIYITMPTLDAVGLGGSGTIRSTASFTGLNVIDVHVSGSGTVDLAVEANATEVKLSGSGKVALKGATSTLSVGISGSGDVNTTDLKSGKCDVRISGSGDATVSVDGDLDASISGSGDVRYKGNANVHSKISGSGSVGKL